MFRDPPAAEQFGQARINISSFDILGNLDSQTLPGKLADHVQHGEGFPAIRGIHHEIITPDMIGVFRTQTDAGIVI